MQAVHQSQARAYTPSTLESQQAAGAYIERANRWATSYGAACADLSAFITENVPVKALGFVSTDALNMSVFGVVFTAPPGDGFIAVPGHVADRLSDTGLRGSAYFPDMSHPLGKAVMAKLNAVSRVAEQRPLLNTVPGLSSVALSGAHVVLSRAIETPEGIAIFAASTALTATAEVIPLVATAPKVAPANESSATARRPAAPRPGH